MILEVDDIHTFYGLSHVLFGVSLGVSEGRIVCLLGRNGAGKSTTLRSIMGLTPPKRGSIVFKGELTTGQQPYLLARKGMAYVPDDRRIFADLSVHDNLVISERRGKAWTIDRIYELFPALKAIKSRKGGYLSGGEQQMLTIARALVTNPEFILLDEPSEGLAPMVVNDIENQVLELRNSGISILLAEQNVKSALKVSDFAYIIDNGRICYMGKIDELKRNDDVRKRYLLV